MKHILLAGCAALAFASLTGTAAAQSKFQVLIGGDAYFQAGYMDDENTGENLRDTEFSNRFRLNVIPSAKADNGLEYGGRIRIRATNSNRSLDYDRAYIFVQGGFGQVRLGTQEGASSEWGIIGPVGDWGTFGGPDGFWMDFVADINDLPVQAQGDLRTYTSQTRSSSVLYQSPTFAGLSLAASFTPVVGNNGASVARTEITGDSDRTLNFKNVYEVGLVYSGEFSGATVEGSAFYSGGEARDGAVGVGFEDLSSVQAGLQVGYAGFKVGGSYSWAGDSGYEKSLGVVSTEDTYTWIAAAQYQFGAFTVGGSYTYSQDPGSTFITGKRDLDLWQAGLTYLVSPGLTVGLEYTHYDVDNKEIGGTPDRDGNIVILQTWLTF
ncbi:porin [Azospirillum sp. RWY-5-1]|uniref:Porin n=1 Tax=Azospirillum oleiclasticum TaxID=2735135 RepID=A0ABX2T808_9PROT|nr:porin [Azospirillum oleiclasticum]NYZ13110.1 porin [Azospirillum oleiclasticum]NYZ20217.1 porin [Azospirillum oleiclasticum]